VAEIFGQHAVTFNPAPLEGGVYAYAHGVSNSVSIANTNVPQYADDIARVRTWLEEALPTILGRESDILNIVAVDRRGSLDFVSNLLPGDLYGSVRYLEDYSYSLIINDALRLTTAGGTLAATLSAIEMDSINTIVESAHCAASQRLLTTAVSQGGSNGSGEDTDSCSLVPLVTNQSLAGQWSSSCAFVARSGSYARFYTFTLTTATTVTIDLTGG